MKKYVSILLVLLLILCFTGCKDSAGDTTPTDNAPKATIEPGYIHFGYNEETDTYDRWYLQNSDDVTYIYFTYDNTENLEDYFVTYNLVKSGVVTMSVSLCYSSNNHVAPPMHSSLYLDLVFEDYFTVYDYSSGERYSRGNADEYNSYFENKTYTSEDELIAITFANDFSCTKSDKKESVSGTWEVTSPSTVTCTFGDAQTKYTIDYYDDLSVKSIEADGEVLYPEISENETINKYKAY